MSLLSTEKPFWIEDHRAKKKKKKAEREEKKASKSQAIIAFWKAF